jgi:hypothetical protein
VFTAAADRDVRTPAARLIDAEAQDAPDALTIEVFEGVRGNHVVTEVRAEEADFRVVTGDGQGYSCGATVAQCHRTFQRSSLTGRSTRFAPAPTHGQRHVRTFETNKARQRVWLAGSGVAFGGCRLISGMSTNFLIITLSCRAHARTKRLCLSDVVCGVVKGSMTIGTLPSSARLNPHRE